MFFPCEAHFVVGMGENILAVFLPIPDALQGGNGKLYRSKYGRPERRRHPGPFSSYFPSTMECASQVSSGQV